MKTRRTLRFHAVRAQAGVALVELALLLAPLVLIVLGVFEAGRALWTFHTLQHAVRDAARHLAVQAAGDATAVQQARCLAVHGQASCLGPPRVSGLSTAMVVVCDASTCPATHALQPTGQGAVDLVSVAIEGYRWSSVGGLVIPALSLPPIRAVMRGAS